MKMIGLVSKIMRRRKPTAVGPPVLGDAFRFPYGPFRFRSRVAKGSPYEVVCSRDLRTWVPVHRGVAREETIEYVDSEAFKFAHRFYRLEAGGQRSTNLIGYATVSLPPGFTMVANPFESSSTVAEIFKGWPERTTLNKFDTTLFRLVENAVKGGKWTNTSERLVPGEGGIFFNPTSDYKSVSFVGEVVEGQFSLPIPSGFSVRSSPVPQPGHLVDDLHFPISDGDVIHVFDGERQKYSLHPYESGKWTRGAPVLGVGESFWVAKTEPGNWIRNLVIES